MCQYVMGATNWKAALQNRTLKFCWTPGWPWASNVPLSQKMIRQSIPSRSREMIFLLYSGLGGPWNSVSSFGLLSTNGHTGESPAKRHENYLGTGTCLVWRETEIAGTFQGGEQKALGSINLHKYPRKGCKDDRARVFSVVPSNRTRGSRHNVEPRRLWLNFRKWIFLSKDNGQSFKAPKGLLGSETVCSDWAGQDFTTFRPFPGQKSDSWYLIAFQGTILQLRGLNQIVFGISLKWS